MTPAARSVLVIPARNEARLLPEVLAAVPRWVWRVVLLDDASRDATWEVMRAWDDPRAVRLRADRPLGVGAAIRAGYREALAIGGRFAVVVAGDAQMDLGELPRLLAPLLAGEADYVQGVRFDRGAPRGPMPRSRIWGNRILSGLSSWSAGVPIADSQCGYTAAGVPFLEHIVAAAIPAGYGFPAYVRIEAHRAGFRVREVPVSALYGSEVSGIRPWRDPALIAARILGRGLRRRAVAAAAALAPARDPVAAGSTGRAT